MTGQHIHWEKVALYTAAREPTNGQRNSRGHYCIEVAAAAAAVGQPFGAEIVQGVR